MAVGQVLLSDIDRVVIEPIAQVKRHNPWQELVDYTLNSIVRSEIKKKFQKIRLLNDLSEQIIEIRKVYYDPTDALVLEILKKYSPFNIKTPDRVLLNKLKKHSAKIDYIFVNLLCRYNMLGYYTNEEWQTIAKKIAVHCPEELVRILQGAKLDRTIVVEILMTAISNERLAVFVLPDISELTILESEDFIKLSEAALTTCPTSLLENIANFKIDDLQKKHKLILLASEKGKIRDKINEYGITDQALLEQLARNQAVITGSGISIYIENYQLQNQKTRFEVALLAAEHCCDLTLLIKSYDLTPEQQFHVAMKAMQYFESALCYFYEYQLKDVQKVVLARLAWQFYPKKFAAYFNRFEIKNEQIRIAFALDIISKVPNQVICNFFNFKITDQNTIVKIAKFVASQTGNMAYYVSKLPIIDESDRIAVAKLLAQYSDDLIQHLPKFKIQDKKVEYEIVLIAAHNPISNVSAHIDMNEYRAYTFEMKKEIALAAAKANGKSVATYLKKYGFEDKQLLLKLANICVLSDDISEHIQNFGLEEHDRIRIAHGYLTGPNNRDVKAYFNKYEISEEKKRQWLFKAGLLAERETRLIYSILFFLKKFDIKDQQFLTEMAFLAANKSPKIFINCMKYFEIKSQKVRIDLAKMCLGHRRSLAYSFRHFMIDNQLYLAEILRKIVVKHPFIVFEKEIEIGIKYNLIFELILIAIANNEDFLKDFLSEKYPNYPIFQSTRSVLPESNPIKTALFEFANRLTQSKVSNDINEAITLFIKSADLDLESVCTSYDYKSKEEATRNWLIKAISLLVSQNNILFRWEERKTFVEELLKKCFKIHNPQTRHIALKLGLEAINEDVSFQYIKAINQKKYLGLFQMIMAGLLEEKETCWSTLELNRHILIPLSRLNKRIKEYRFRDALLLFIDYFYQLEKQNLIFLFRVAFDITDIPQKLIRRTVFLKLTLLRNIAVLCGNEAVNIANLNTYQHDLEGYYLKLFMQAVPYVKSDNFFEKFQRTFGACRNPLAIVHYASCLNQLNEYKEEALRAFAHYIDLVLEGVDAFKQGRMATENNRHLRKIFKHYPYLRESWPKEYRKKIETKEISKCKGTNINVLEYFSKKILRDKHISLPIVERYLIDFQANQISSFGSEGSEVDKLIISTMTDGFLQKSKTEQFEIIDRILDLLALDANSPFYNDLQALKFALHPAKIVDDLVMTLIDDPYDLLLCGTEILGSCQSVFGKIEFNRGLLGYLLDGKNRMIAIKNKEGVLVARAMLRLVWDKEIAKPVLFLSEIYTNVPDIYNNIIIKLAKKVAKDLKLDLVRGEEGSSRYYPSTLFGLGGPVPFDYIDEADGIAIQGKYKVKNAQYL